MGDVVGLHEGASASARQVGPEGANSSPVYLVVNKVFFENRDFPTACTVSAAAMHLSVDRGGVSKIFRKFCALKWHDQSFPVCELAHGLVRLTMTSSHPYSMRWAPPDRVDTRRSLLQQSER